MMSTIQRVLSTPSAFFHVRLRTDIRYSSNKRLTPAIGCSTRKNTSKTDRYKSFPFLPMESHSVRQNPLASEGSWPAGNGADA